MGTLNAEVSKQGSVFPSPTSAFNVGRSTFDVPAATAAPQGGGTTNSRMNANWRREQRQWIQCPVFLFWWPCSSHRSTLKGSRKGVAQPFQGWWLWWSLLPAY